METEKIILGGGCFWCIEAVYKRINGVQQAVPGYAGGHTENPAYEQVCCGQTGHAEVVEITYKPHIISLEEILHTFWKAHDPTTPNRQGHDIGTQYRSIILCISEKQCERARNSRSRIPPSVLNGRKPVTEIALLHQFWPAEENHMNYFSRNRRAGYCRMVIEPKLSKLKIL